MRLITRLAVEKSHRHGKLSGRATGLHPVGRGFDSLTVHQTSPSSCERLRPVRLIRSGLLMRRKQPNLGCLLEEGSEAFLTRESLKSRPISAIDAQLEYPISSSRRMGPSS